MPFFRFAVIICAIISVHRPASAVVKRAFWTKKKTAARECGADLAPPRSPLVLGYLDMVRPGRKFDGKEVVERTPRGEWRTSPVSRTKETGHMSYEVLGLPLESPELARALTSAFIVFLRFGGDTDHVAIKLTPRGTVRVDLGLGVPATSFVLEFDRILDPAVQIADEPTDEERDLIDAWFAERGIVAEETLPRDAAE